MDFEHSVVHPSLIEFDVGGRFTPTDYRYIFSQKDDFSDFDVKNKTNGFAFKILSYETGNEQLYRNSQFFEIKFSDSGVMENIAEDKITIDGIIFFKSLWGLVQNIPFNTSWYDNKNVDKSYYKLTMQPGTTELKIVYDLTKPQ